MDDEEIERWRQHMLADFRAFMAAVGDEQRIQLEAWLAASEATREAKYHAFKRRLRRRTWAQIAWSLGWTALSFWNAFLWDRIQWVADVCLFMVLGMAAWNLTSAFFSWRDVRQMRREMQQ